MISALDRKLLRDLWKMRGQVLAISLVMSAGVAVFVMSISAMVSLADSQQAYYDQYRFANLFSGVRRAPNNLESRIKSIPGVSQVDTRITFDVVLNLEDVDRPVTAQLISIPERGEPKLNHLHLLRGRWIEPFHPSEVLVSEAFALAHDLNPGDSVTAIMNGRFRRLQIVGIAISPEFIINIPRGGILPDDRQFGVFWTGRDHLEAVFDMKEAFNEISIKTQRAANEAQVIEDIDQLLRPYGCIGGFDRDQQVSHQFVTDEIRQLQATAILVPSIFLFVAGFLLNIVFSRVIGLQREQIAALKALGYSNLQIAIHYFKMVLLISLLGVTIGVLFGIWMGHSLTLIYTKFFKFPIFYYRFEGWMLLLVILISAATAILGTVYSLVTAFRLPPAEAMRPEPPESYQASIIERLRLTFFFPQTARMIIRKLERNLFKSTLNVTGIALAIATLILGGFSLDAITYMMDFQFRQSQRQHSMMTLFEADHRRVIRDIEKLPGVMSVEPFRSAPVRIRSGHIERRIGILGLEDQAELFRVFDQNNQQLALPPEGMVLSEKLARVLNVNVGQEVEVEVLDQHLKKLRIPVVATIQEFQGINGYMKIDQLNRLLGQGPLISGAFLQIDSDREVEFYRFLKQTPKIAGLTVKQMAIESFEATIAENLLVMRGFNIFFASLIAFGVVYNATRVSLAEQSRELATLRVLGFTRFEVSMILLGELAFITLAAIPLGCLIGYGFAAVVIQGLDTELYRIPLIVFPRTFGYAVVTVVIATFLSGLIVRRKLDKLDLVAVLKAKE